MKSGNIGGSNYYIFPPRRFAGRTRHLSSLATALILFIIFPVFAYSGQGKTPSKAEIKKILETTRDFSGMDMDGVDLSGMDLSLPAALRRLYYLYVFRRWKLARIIDIRGITALGLDQDPKFFQSAAIQYSLFRKLKTFLQAPSSSTKHQHVCSDV